MIAESEFHLSEMTCYKIHTLVSKTSKANLVEGRNHEINSQKEELFLLVKLDSEWNLGSSGVYLRYVTLYEL